MTFTAPIWDIAVQQPSQLGEGPVWDVHSQTLLWVDILSGHIHEFDPSTGVHTTLAVGQMVGTVALRQSGGLVAALKTGFAYVDRQTGAVTPIADPEADRPGNRFNDGKCDPAGRFWAGTMSLTEEPNAGRLYRLDPDGTVTRQLDGVSISNGLAWSLDHRIMYYIDTPTRQVVSFAYDLETGVIRNRQTVLHFADSEGFPDGMTIDTDGMLWVAFWDGWQLTRWNPQTGQLLTRIKLPVSRVTSCTFAGPALQDLYITTARTGLTETQLAEQPLAGALFVIKHTGYQGLEANEYAG